MVLEHPNRKEARKERSLSTTEALPIGKYRALIEGGGAQACKGAKRGGAFWMLTYNNHFGTYYKCIYIYCKIRFDGSTFLGCIFKNSSTAVS